MFGLAGQHGADAHAFHPGSFYPVGQLIGDLLVHVHQYLSGNGMAHPLQGETPDYTVSQGFDDFLSVLDRPALQTVDGTAVLLVHHYILGNVDQSACKVARIGGLQSRIGQALAGSIGGYEELYNRKPLLEVASNRELDDVPGRLSHQSPHATKLTDLAPGAPSA